MTTPTLTSSKVYHAVKRREKDWQTQGTYNDLKEDDFLRKHNFKMKPQQTDPEFKAGLRDISLTTADIFDLFFGAMLLHMVEKTTKGSKNATSDYTKRRVQFFKLAQDIINYWVIFWVMGIDATKG